jgi:hypothetical protein
MTPGAVRTTTRNTSWGNWGTVVGSNRVRWVGEDGREFRIHAHRCDGCGRVELAATEPVKAVGTSGCLVVMLLVSGLGAVAFTAGWLLAG